MTVHHNVIFNCGKAPVNDSQSGVAGFGLVLKGNGHAVCAPPIAARLGAPLAPQTSAHAPTVRRWANTIFDANSAELCLPACVERLKPFRPQYPRLPQNGRTFVVNTVADVIGAKCGCNAVRRIFAPRQAAAARDPRQCLSDHG